MTNDDAIKWLENLKQDIGQIRHEDLWPYAQAIDEICGLLKDQEDIVRCKDCTPTVNGWISVKDRLPKKNQIVIASDGEHTWDVGMYKSLCGKPSEWNWKKNTVKTVLWWMPKDGALPEPPKEEN